MWSLDIMEILFVISKHLIIIIIIFNTYIVLFL